MDNPKHQFISSRNRARRIAMQAVYQWQMTGQPMVEVKTQFESKKDYQKSDQAHFQALLDSAEQKRFNTAIAECMNIPFERSDLIERSIVLNAAYEIVCCDDIDSAVAITEAIHLAKKFGAEHSYQFVNAVLDKFAKKHSQKTAK